MNIYFSISSRLTLGPSQPPNQWEQGALSLGVKWQEAEADLSPPTSAEVKKKWIYNSTYPYAIMAYCLVEHRDNIAFPLMLFLKTTVRNNVFVLDFIVHYLLQVIRT
jgi:hypothetical protein